MSCELRYALYHFKKTVFRLCLMVLYTVIVINSDIHSSYRLYNVGPGVEAGYVHTFTLTSFGFNFIMLGFLVAILEFAQFKNRRNLDTWYSLPLARWKLALIHYINGAVQLFAAHTISFIWGYIKIAKYIPTLNLDRGALISMYFVVLGTGLVLYGMFMFPFMVANNTFDGVFFAFAYTFLPITVLSFLLDGILRYTLAHFLGTSEFSNGMLFVVYDLGARYSTLFSSSYKGNMVHSLLPLDIVWITTWIILGIAMTVLGIWLFDRKQAEKIGGISDSIIGYRLLIPLIMFTMVMGIGGSFGIGLLYSIVTMILYVIFRRGIKLHIPDIIILGIITIMANIPCEYGSAIADLIRKIFGNNG